MLKRIGADQWKYQLKYSTGVTKMCASEAATVAKFSDTLVKSTKTISDKMDDVEAAFAQKASQDLKAWNCRQMYPKP
jgi:hypothetical protein